MPMSTQLLQKTPALVLLIGAVFLMQSHAWDFWKTYDANTGWLWALMLEGAALWLWAQRNVLANGIALLATLLVLAGPLYQVSQPAVEMLHQADKQPTVNAERKAELKADKAQLIIDLATYNENSKSRAGWADLITTTKMELKAVNAELKALSDSELKPAPMTWQALAVIAMQAMAMIIFQVVIVQSIRSLTAAPDAKSKEDSEGKSLLTVVKTLKDIFDNPFGTAPEKGSLAKNQATAQSLRPAA